MSPFHPATRVASKARIALAGPSGSGKTYTALAFAHTLGERVAVIDTERGSASKYAGLNGWQFDTVTPDSFSPDSLVTLLGEAADYDVVVVDSLSHYWMGIDGMLEQADRMKRGANSFSGWKEVRPAERRMIDALVSHPGHVIVTMRTKTEYVIEENDRGKKEPRKVGMKPEQREGIEYEFDLVGELDFDNTLTVSKSRIHTLAKAVVPMPGAEFAQKVADWLSEGEQIPTPIEYRDRLLAATAADDVVAIGNEIRAHQVGGAAIVVDGQTGTLMQLALRQHESLKLATPPASVPDQPAESAPPTGQDELFAALAEIDVHPSAFAAWAITPQGWSVNVRALDDAGLSALAAKVRANPDAVRAGIAAHSKADAARPEQETNA